MQCETAKTAPPAPRRAVTLPAKLRESPCDAENVETLYEHSHVKIVAFTASAAAKAVDPDAQTRSLDAVPVSSQFERTIAIGSFRLYRAPASVAFLSCGTALQPILPKSQCWRADEDNSKFILQIRRPIYWRIEMPVTTSIERKQATRLKEVLEQTLQFEQTPCPFQRSFQVELPETPAQADKKPWTPRRHSDALLDANAGTQDKGASELQHHSALANSPNLAMMSGWADAPAAITRSRTESETARAGVGGNPIMSRVKVQRPPCRQSISLDALENASETGDEATSTQLAQNPRSATVATGADSSEDESLFENDALWTLTSSVDFNTVHVGSGERKSMMRTKLRHRASYSLARRSPKPDLAPFPKVKQGLEISGTAQDNGQHRRYVSPSLAQLVYADDTSQTFNDQHSVQSLDSAERMLSPSTLDPEVECKVVPTADAENENSREVVYNHTNFSSSCTGSLTPQELEFEQGLLQLPPSSKDESLGSSSAMTRSNSGSNIGLHATERKGCNAAAPEGHEHDAVVSATFRFRGGIIIIAHATGVLIWLFINAPRMLLRFVRFALISMLRLTRRNT